MASDWLPVVAPDYFQQVVEWGQSLPHCQALGLQLVAAQRGQVTLTLPFKPELVGHFDSQTPHGGVLTSLADTSGAFSIYTLLAEPESVATLDLRLDYLRPSATGATIYCTAICERLTSQIAFTQASLYQDHPDKPLATAVATYMRMSMPAEEMRR